MDFDITITCDFSVILGDTLKEKYEGIYVKLLEIKNILRAKAQCGGMRASKFTINAGEFLVDLMECSRTYCFGRPPDRTIEKPFIGEFYIGDKCDIYWDKNLNRNEAIVECEFGKGLLIIDNIPQLEN